MGVLHLDLKPDNVLIVGDIPKLADFGIADLLIPGQGGCRPSRNEVGGTLVWSAPEMMVVHTKMSLFPDTKLSIADSSSDSFICPCPIPIVASGMIC